MIQLRTVMEVADNSGAKVVQCIKVLGGSKRRYARVGDIIVVVITSYSIHYTKLYEGRAAHSVLQWIPTAVLLQDHRRDRNRYLALGRGDGYAW